MTARFRQAPLWICPLCGAKLVGRNMAHACGAHSVEAFLAGKGPSALGLWNSLVERVNACGPFEFAPAKTRVAFMVRVRFLAVTSLSDGGMTFHIWLRERSESDRFFRVDPLAPKAVIHWARIQRPAQIDEELGDLICDAYQIGAGNT